MTQEEFDKTDWKFGMRCVFNGKIYPIISVDFHEKLISINQDSAFIHGKEVEDWKRCENIKLVK